MIPSGDSTTTLHKTRLRNTTLWAIFSLCYFYISRTVGTLFPTLYQNITVAQFSEILSVLGSLILALFFVFFLTDYARSSQPQLRNAAVAAIIGSTLLVLLRIKGLFILFGGLAQLLERMSSSLADLVWSQGVGVALSLIGSLFIVFFFIVFRGKVDRATQPKLKKAVRFAVIGSLIGALIQTLALFNYVLLRQLGFFLSNPKTAVSVLFPIVTIAFALTLYFYIVFYRLQNEGNVRAEHAV